MKKQTLITDGVTYSFMVAQVVGVDAAIVAAELHRNGEEKPFSERGIAEATALKRHAVRTALALLQNRGYLLYVKHGAQGRIAIVDTARIVADALAKREHEGTLRVTDAEQLVEGQPVLNIQLVDVQPVGRHNNDKLVDVQPVLNNQLVEGQPVPNVTSTELDTETNEIKDKREFQGQNTSCSLLLSIKEKTSLNMDSSLSKKECLKELPGASRPETLGDIEPLPEDASEPVVRKRAPRKAAEKKPGTPPSGKRLPPVGQRSLHEIAEALAAVVGMDLTLNKGRLFGLAKKLAVASVPATGALVSQQYGAGSWWYANDWRGKKGQKPSLANIQETWGAWTQGNAGASAERVVLSDEDRAKWLAKYGGAK